MRTPQRLAACALLLLNVLKVCAFAPTTLTRRPIYVGAIGSAPRARDPRLDFFDWLEGRLRARREKASRDGRPERIILVRHGQSEGNTNKNAYSVTPDSQIALTERGWAQGVVAGLQIRQLVGNEPVRFFYSPYLRARQTLLAMLQAYDGQTVQLSSEPRLREQDFGNFQDSEAMDSTLKERQKFGRFYYRFPNGEAGTDVFDRMASFITYMFRTMSQTDYFDSDMHGLIIQNDSSQPASPPARNYVLVTHGLLMRIFCMCYLRWTVTEFEQVWNPSNCEIWVLQKIESKGNYELVGRWRASPYGGSFVDVKFGENKNEPMYAHMKRPLVSRRVTPGAPDALDSIELAHLRDLPGPKSNPRRGWGAKGNRAMLAAESVLAYWAKDSKAKSVADENAAPTTRPPRTHRGRREA